MNVLELLFLDANFGSLRIFLGLDFSVKGKRAKPRKKCAKSIAHRKIRRKRKIA